jgi:hypothetical protein
MAQRVISVITFLVLCTSLGCSVSHHVRKVNEVNIDRPGIYYYLPQTVVRVELPVKKTTTQPGELGLLLNKLNNQDLDQEGVDPEFRTVEGIRKFVGGVKEITTFSVDPGVITSRTRPDHNALFVAELKGGASTKREITAELDEAGLITTGGSKYEDQKLEYAVKTLEVAAGVAGKVIGFAGDTTTREKVLNPHAKHVLAALDDLKKLQGRIVELAAATGGAVPSETFEKQLAELRRQEEALFARFRTKTVMIWPAVFEFVPSDEASLQDIELLKINKAEGVTARTSALLGDVPSAFVGKGKENLIITCIPKVDGKVSGNNTTKLGSDTETGFVYRVPVNVVIRLVDNHHNPLASQIVQVAQLGPLAALPSKPGGSTSEYSVSFHPKTGGLKKATLSSTPPDVRQGLTAVGNATGTVLDALEAKKQADAAARDEITQLRRQADELELRLKIRDLETKLQSTPSP